MRGIGMRIKELMGKEKIDTPALAKKLNKTKQAVYEMLEKDDLNTLLLRKIAVVFNVPITYFFTDGDENSEVVKLKSEVEVLKEEIKRLEELKLPSQNDKALDVSMKFFEAAKEMFNYYNQLNK